MHVYDKRVGGGKRIIRRDVFRLGLLSPDSGRVCNSSLTLGEPSALLLTPESVMYPYLDNVSGNGQQFCLRVKSFLITLHLLWFHQVIKVIRCGASMGRE